MLRSACVLSALSLVTSGCAGLGPNYQSSVDVQSDESADEGGAASDVEWELQELGRKVELAKSRLEIARLESESFQAGQEVRVEHAKTEALLASKDLAKFVDADRPAQLASGELALRTARDRAQEAIDELAQIELMYAEQDLNDKTAEFVVSRGRRSAERAAARIKIQEAEFATLTESELPIKQTRLEMAARAKETALAEAERDVKIGTLNQAVALREAQNAVDKAVHELAEAQAKQ